VRRSANDRKSRKTSASSRKVETPIWIIEDTGNHHLQSGPVFVRLYRIRDGTPVRVLATKYNPGLNRSKQARAQRILDLLRRAKATRGIVICSFRAASPQALARLLIRAGFAFIIEIPRAAKLLSLNSRSRQAKVLTARLKRAHWKTVVLRNNAPNQAACELGNVVYAGLKLRCFALSSGRIVDYSRGVMIGLSSVRESRITELANLLSWTRYLRPVVRRASRRSASARASIRVTQSPIQGNGHSSVALHVRSNLKVANLLDRAAAAVKQTVTVQTERGRFDRGRREINIIDLFAGAGGLELGFLLSNDSAVAPRYRVLCSAEVHPVYVNTLRENHAYLRKNVVRASDVPADVEPIDLRTSTARQLIREVVRDSDVDVLVGGPPCQGFSSANRNSWSRSNPNNQLMDIFLHYVSMIRPKVLVLENVQGILWTANNGKSRTSVAAHVSDYLRRAGYTIYPQLLDAAWYGVPQHRSRFFLIGLHRDLGYKPQDFDSWGPFPKPTHGPRAGVPYVTVKDAIRDLPRIANGQSTYEIQYGADKKTNGFLDLMRRHAPTGVVWDHVTSRHAEYVIRRYRKIPPGGNWASVAQMLTNYSAVERTHSNIYRRLVWHEPSVTIGHYRKSMIVHPSQNRGLSVREAARLQSFPDWFRLAAGASELAGGLTYKQQQLANAVCPLVAKAIAEFLRNL
jgi:DNA-cytosine methyltransferase